MRYEIDGVFLIVLLCFSLLNEKEQEMQEPMIVLVATPKSHPFEERRIKVGPENNPIKIGRAVARIQASSDNAVFDCKVLSRNHAMLWYCDGDFYIRDTNSSNGTFVNNTKLQAVSKDSDIRKIYSGDIIQLGVQIVENTNKVAYGCIYAVIQCYGEDGKLVEVKNSYGDDGIGTEGTLVNSRKLFQMQQYVSEAMYREKLREDKINELMSLIEANEQAADTAWKALVAEDRLLAKIEALEAQLATYSNNNNPDKQKEELLLMIDEKTKFEAMTKEQVRHLNEELGETSSRLKDMERSLISTEAAHSQMKAKSMDLEVLLAETTESYDLKANELDTAVVTAQEAQNALATCEEKLADLQQKYLKLSKTSVANETATSLSRLLGNALNSGSIIEQQELDTLLDALSNANYLPNDISSSNSSDTCLKTEINGVATEDSKRVESYLKEILALQAQIRDLESDSSKRNNEVFSEMKIHYSNAYEDGVTFPNETVMRKMSRVDPDALEYSPTAHESFEPFDVIDNETYTKRVDPLIHIMLLFSLSPLFALILSMAGFLHNRFVVPSIEKDCEQKKEE